MNSDKEMSDPPEQWKHYYQTHPTTHTTHHAMIVIFLSISITIDLWWIPTPLYIDQEGSVFHYVLYGFSSLRIVLGNSCKVMVDIEDHNMVPHLLL